MGLVGYLVNRYKWLVIPLGAVYFGGELQKYYDGQMTMFRDKSALYGRVLKEGEPPSWT